MADTKISALTNYTTPIGADIYPVVDTVNSATKGITFAKMHMAYSNFSTGSQVASTTDVYITGSNISIPSGGPYAGTIYHLVFDIVKSAGTGSPVITIRYGTAGSTADTSRASFTYGVGTSVADTAKFEINCLFRTVGSSTSAVIQGSSGMICNLPLTGFGGTTSIKAVQNTGGGFDSTVGSSIIGASFNGSTAFAGTFQLVRAELIL